MVLEISIVCLALSLLYAVHKGVNITLNVNKTFSDKTETPVTSMVPVSELEKQFIGNETADDVAIAKALSAEANSLLGAINKIIGGDSDEFI